MELFERLDAVHDRWNVLRHPFYRRWSDGALAPEELAFYAAEYRHAVVALADQTAAAARLADPEARAELTQHATEESDHIELWDEFARATGADPQQAPLPETEACVGAFTAGETLCERLAVLYAVEAAQPAISETKLDGLVDHYGMAREEPAAGYFRLHSVRDHEHAAHSRRLIAARHEPSGAERLVEVAGAALEGNWHLLDGVEARRVELVGG